MNSWLLSLTVIAALSQGVTAQDELSAREERATPLLRCALWSAHSKLPTISEQAPELLRAWAKESQPWIDLIWPTIKNEMGNFGDALQDRSPDILLGMGLATASRETEEFLESEVPYGQGVSLDQVLEWRAIVAEGKFREQNCGLLLR